MNQEQIEVNYDQFFLTPVKERGNFVACGRVDLCGAFGDETGSGR